MLPGFTASSSLYRSTSVYATRDALFFGDGGYLEGLWGVVSPAKKNGGGGGHAPVCNPSDCPPGWRCCGSGCADIESDPGNCGSCGNRCSSGQTCCNGRCCSGPCCDGKCCSRLAQCLPGGGRCCYPEGVIVIIAALLCIFALEVCDNDTIDTIVGQLERQLPVCPA
jgi:hypothetical protein